MSDVLMWVGFALLGIGTVGGWFPAWKSARLSPQSIQRRTYWTGCVLAVPMLFLSLLPDLTAALFGGVGMALGMIAIAFRWTGHIKIGNRIYAASPSLRVPDRPPALSASD